MGAIESISRVLNVKGNILPSTLGCCYIICNDERWHAGSWRKKYPNGIQ